MNALVHWAACVQVCPWPWSNEGERGVYTRWEADWEVHVPRWWHSTQSLSLA